MNKCSEEAKLFPQDVIAQTALMSQKQDGTQYWHGDSCRMAIKLKLLHFESLANLILCRYEAIFYFACDTKNFFKIICT